MRKHPGVRSKIEGNPVHRVGPEIEVRRHRSLRNVSGAAPEPYGDQNGEDGQHQTGAGVRPNRQKERQEDQRREDCGVEHYSVPILQAGGQLPIVTRLRANRMGT